MADEPTLQEDYLQKMMGQFITPDEPTIKLTPKRSTAESVQEVILAHICGLMDRDELTPPESGLLGTLLAHSQLGPSGRTFVDDIVKFNEDRNLKVFNPDNERRMIEKELDEFSVGAKTNDPHEMVDGLCDVVVFALGAIHKMGYCPTQCMEETLKEVLSRKGELDPSTGKWEKDPNQDPSTLYKANYTKR